MVYRSVKSSTNEAHGTAPDAPSAVRLAAVGTCLVGVCYGLARFAYGLFVPAFREDFDLGPTAAGAVASGSYVAYCLAVVAATVLTPRLGARRVAVAAGTLATAGTALVALAPTSSVLGAGVLLAGASTGVASPPLAHAVARTVRAARRDRTQAVVNAGTGLGVAVAGPVALVAQDSWRAAWAVFALLAAATTLWAARVVPPARDDGASAPSLLPRPLLPVGAGRLLLGAAVMGLASAAVWTFGLDLLVTEGGTGPTTARLAWVLLGALGVLGAAAGDLEARLGPARAWTTTTVALAGATAVLALAPGTPALTHPAAAVFGGSYIAMSGLLLLGGTRVYSDEPSAGVGIAFLVLALGQAAGSLALGALASGTGLRTAVLVAAGVGLIGALAPPRTS